MAAPPSQDRTAGIARLVRLALSLATPRPDNLGDALNGGLKLFHAVQHVGHLSMRRTRRAFVRRGRVGSVVAVVAFAVCQRAFVSRARLAVGSVTFAVVASAACPVSLARHRALPAVLLPVPLPPLLNFLQLQRPVHGEPFGVRAVYELHDVRLLP